MTLSEFNQEIYMVITTEVDKKNACKLAAAEDFILD